MQIIDPTGVPVNDAGNYPLSLESAIAWCIEHEATVDFYGKSVVMLWLPDGRLCMQPTFIEAVEEFGRRDVP